MKVEVVINWGRPNETLKVCYFLELVGYYYRFVEGFSNIAVPLTKLTRKGTKFLWTLECEENFLKLKCHLISALVLVVPNNTGGFQVYCDA